MLGGLKASMESLRTPEDPNRHFRLAGVILSSVFLIGAVAVWFAPETKDKPLPE
jgi:hypothetical protein